LKFFDGERYELRAWVVMPNHVHAVVWPKPPHTLSKILHGWKSFTAHELNKLLSKKAVSFWQSESYDHLIRNDDDFHRCCQYTLMNPVNAGLCAEYHLWRWSSVYVAQSSPAAGSRTVPVRVPKTGGGTPP
jgi:REP element-mobilizing transposase RayT